MLFARNGKIPPDDQGIVFSVRMICLLATVVATAAGCASPLYRTHSELSRRKNAIHNMGLLPPAIAMYEEQYRFKLIPHEELFPEATNAVRKAFIEEMTTAGFPVVAIDGEDRELNEMADLFGAVMRGDDFVATRDGVFLQNIFVERIHVDQVELYSGMFPLAALSSKQWPLRTVKSMKKRFAPGMSPTDAADVLLDSRRNDPAVAGLEVREIATRTIAGNRAFKAVFDFRLRDPGRMPLYRSVYYGFMLEDWFYSIGYTAALRQYFQKDAEAFESVLQSFTLTEK